MIQGDAVSNRFVSGRRMGEKIYLVDIWRFIHIRRRDWNGGHSIQKTRQMRGIAPSGDQVNSRGFSGRGNQNDKGVGANLVREKEPSAISPILNGKSTFLSGDLKSTGIKKGGRVP